jgi:two-component system, NarL family, response regulator LiaR
MKTVLIAHDHLSVRDALRSVFNSEPGLLVCAEAEDGQKAVERALELHPDLIVLDMLMPVLNGCEAAHTLKAAMPDTPILMFTGHTSKFTEAYAVASGVDAFVAKDEDVSLLINRARSLLSRAETRRLQSHPA